MTATGPPLHRHLIHPRLHPRRRGGDVAIVTVRRSDAVVLLTTIEGEGRNRTHTTIVVAIAMAVVGEKGEVVVVEMAAGEEREVGGRTTIIIAIEAL